jgi:hypothetical protein
MRKKKKILINPTPLINPVLPLRHFVLVPLKPISNAIEGETMRRCPKCLQPRVRISVIRGLYYRHELPKTAHILPPHRSDRLLWRNLSFIFFIWWLVLPPLSGKGKVWSKVRFFAKCVNPRCRHRYGVLKGISERGGIRPFSLLKRMDQRIRHVLRLGIIVAPAKR